MPGPRLPPPLASNNLNAMASCYPKMVKLAVPLTVQAYAIAAGVTAQVITIGARSGIANFATRFASLFKEWCVVGADIEVRLLVPITNPSGFMALTIDEVDSAVPTAACLEKAHVEMQLVNPTQEPPIHHLKWIATGYEDLQWQQTVNDDPAAYVKLFAAVASTFTGGATSGNVSVTGTLACCFRQYV